ncbi:uncharacterized protein [Amphiura filiformis]|uniref:uncharacterized protein n=1 Tax=Amphiura filiformis TaxID=82378 RepID=UPI003B225D96
MPDLQDNELPIINYNAFVSLTSLRRLNFTNNAIKSQFKLPSSLTNLFGGFNNLTNIFGMFNGSFNLSVIHLEGNQISSIPKGTFASCHKLTTLYLSQNNIQDLSRGSFLGLKNLRVLDIYDIQMATIKADLFREIRQTIHTLSFSVKGLTDIEPGALNFSLLYLHIGKIGKMHFFPGGIFTPSKGGDIDFGDCTISSGVYADEKITDISPRAFDGIRMVKKLSLRGHRIKHLPPDLFRNIDFFAIRLSNNLLEDLPDGFLRSSPNLTDLSLYGNRLKCISNKTFMGLRSLKRLYLFGNQITEIPPLTFYETNLEELYIFGNNITSISKEALRTHECTLQIVHLYYNCLEVIEEGAFDCTAESRCSVYYSKSCLSETPHFPSYVRMFGVGDHVNARLPYLSELRFFGFQCEPPYCIPCKPGTFGDRVHNCLTCPAGGYYQERSGQVSIETEGIGCDLCTNGTFVSPNQAPGTRPSNCQVCPIGTNKNMFAGFRACPCLDGYYRKDRFGPCMPCPKDGINCSHEFQKLKPGFWWTWEFSLNKSAHNQDQNPSIEYKAFVTNLLTYNRSYDTTSTKFDGALPKPYPCLRGIDSCPALNGIDGSCGEGYEGWLCSRCSSDYYSWFEYCIRCPPIWHLILEALCVFILVCIVASITIRDVRRQSDASRSLVDILVARFKIVLGYYQITGAIFTSLHNIHWPQEIMDLATVFRVFEFNIFKLIAKPSCFIDKLELNIYNEFVLGLIFCCLVLILPCIIYLCRWLYLQIKLSKYDRNVNREKVKNYLKHLRSKCYLFIVLVLFITYLSLCDVILSLMPVACQEFCVDENNFDCRQRLRSDYSIDCQTQKHKDFIKAAYFALLYVVGYPLVVFIVTLKNSPRKLKEAPVDQEHEDDNESNCTEEFTMDEDDDEFVTGRENHLDDVSNIVVENEETESMTAEETPRVSKICTQTQMNNHSLKYPLYIRFLCENYKPEYWYWEMVELVRKVLQTTLVVLYGSGDPFYLGVTIALSVIFLTSHAYFKPMKDSFEHWLQMTSLVAIFLNLLCAEVLLVPLTDPSGHRQTAMAVFVILLNMLVVLLAVGNSILILWRSVKQHGRNGMCTCRNCLTIVTGLLSSASNVSGHVRPNNRNPNHDTIQNPVAV